MLQPKPDSIWVIAARICQRILNALPAAFQVGLSGDAPEQRLTVGRPVLTFGGRPRREFDENARRSSDGMFVVPEGLLPLKARTWTQLGGRPRLAEPWFQDRCRWLPRPWLASPL
jgi:hypothetical protein